MTQLCNILVDIMCSTRLILELGFLQTLSMPHTALALTFSKKVFLRLFGYLMSHKSDCIRLCSTGFVEAARLNAVASSLGSEAAMWLLTGSQRPFICDIRPRKKG